MDIDRPTDQRAGGQGRPVRSFCVWLAVVLLIVAGCASPLAPDPTETPGAESPTPTESSTPSLTPTASPTPTPSQLERLPPGTSPRGFDAPAELLTAHVDALARTGFVTTGRGNATVLRQGFLVDVESAQRNRVTTNASEYRLHREVAGGPVVRVRDGWGNRSVQYRRTQTNGDQTYSQHPPRSVPALAGRGLLLPYLQGGNYSLNASRRVGNETHFRFRATDADDQEAVLRALPDAAQRVTSFQAVVVVDAEGRVHSLTAVIGYVIRDQPATQRLEFRLERTGVEAVERPAWVDTAQNATENG